MKCRQFSTTFEDETPAFVFYFADLEQAHIIFFPRSLEPSFNSSHDAYLKSKLTAYISYQNTDYLKIDLHSDNCF